MTVPPVASKVKLTVKTSQTRLTSLRKDDKTQRKHFLDKGLFIARESAKPFLQAYKQKYRIELSDVSPFNKERIKAEMKKALIEKAFMEQLLQITKHNKTINLNDPFLQGEESHSRQQSRTSALWLTSAASGGSKESRSSVFSQGLESRLRHSRQHYLKHNGRPTDCSAFRSTYHANDQLYSNVVNFNNSYRTDEETELLSGLDRVVSQQASLEQEIRRHLSFDRIRKQRMARTESFSLSKTAPI